MKAQIYINRHIVQANKKASAESGRVVDEPAIAVNTYLGSVYAKEVDLPASCTLIQDAAHARCSGATIWIEVPEFESLVIDGVKATRTMLSKPKQTAVVKDKGAQTMSKIKIKGRDVYREQELIGTIKGNRFPEGYRRRMSSSSDFKFVPEQGDPIDLSMFAYFKDACDWLRQNL